MAGLQLGGLASGLDTNLIISQLMAIERRPRARLERQQAAVQARQDALRDINAKLKSLKLAASGLTSAAAWTPQQTLTSTDSARVAFAATGAVAAGTYDVAVQQLATTASQTWSTQQRNNPSQLTFTHTGSGTQYVIDIAPNSTVDQIVSAINADASVPVTAVNYNGQLLLQAKASGTGGSFTVSGQVLNGQTTSVAGVDAMFTVNGASYTSSTNTSTTAIAGAELTLGGVTTSPVRLTATPLEVDKDALVGKVKAFVEAYNAVVDLVRGKVTEKRVANAETIIDAKKGVLFGDSALNNVLFGLRMSVMEPLSVGNAATLDELAEIGISTGAATGGASTADSLAGKLVFDETKFRNAYAADPSAVERMFRGDGTQPGFASRVDTLLGPFVDTGGLIDGRITAAGSEITRLKSAMDRMDERLARKEEYLRRQFTALETAMQRSQMASAEMMAQLGGFSSSSD